jgi:hypothetical protein
MRQPHSSGTSPTRPRPTRRRSCGRLVVPCLALLFAWAQPAPARAQIVATGNVYFLGDDITVAASGSGPVAYTLEAILEDRSSVIGEIYSGTGTLSAGVAYLPTTMIPRKGVYRLSGTGISARRILLLDHLPSVGDPLKWPFGSITSDDKTQQGAPMAEEFYRVGLRFLHLDYPISTINAIGSSTDPNAGRISAGWEAFINRSAQLGVHPILKLMANYSDIAQPTNLNGPFYTGLRRIQSYYQGKLKYWMLGNEVEGGGYSQFTVDQYANTIRNMSQALKGVDSQATIVAGEFYNASSSNQHLTRLLEPAYRDSWDILSGHAVTRGGALGTSWASEYVQRLQGLNKPFWDTEANGTTYGGPSEVEGLWSSYFPMLSQTDVYGGINKLMLRSFCLETWNGSQWVPGYYNPASRCLSVDMFMSIHYNANWDVQWQLKSHYNSNSQLIAEQNEKVINFRAAADFLYGARGLTRMPTTGGNYNRADGYIYQYGPEYALALWQNTTQASQARELILTTSDPITMVDSFGNPYPLRNTGGQVKVWVPQEVVYLRGFRSIPAIALDTSSTDAPYFLTSPPTQAVVGRPYSYTARAYDSDVATTGTNSVPRITYSLVSGPTGMTVSGGDSRALLIAWTPQAAGTYPVVVRATSTHGTTLTVDQSFNVTVAAAGTNVPPYLHSEPMSRFARTSYIWRYNANAHDPNGDSLTYSVSGLPGATIDPVSGFIQWTPPGAGQHTVTVRATDPQGLAAAQTFTVVAGSLDGDLTPPAAPTGLRVIP